MSYSKSYFPLIAILFVLIGLVDVEINIAVEAYIELSGQIILGSLTNDSAYSVVVL